MAYNSAVANHFNCRGGDVVGQFNYGSARAKKARLSTKLRNGPVWVILGLVAAVAVLASIAAIISDSKFIGYLLLIPAVLIFIFRSWYKGELEDLPPKNSGSTASIDDFLEVNVLGKHKSVEVSSQSLAEAIKGLDGERFYALRFGLGADLMAGNQTIDVVWQEALRLHSQHPDPNGVNSAILACALVRTSPNYQQILNQFKLADEDILSGLRWYEQLRSTIAHYHSKNHYGGIGRDWAAGYTPVLNRFGRNVSAEIQYGAMYYQDVSSHYKSIDQIVAVFSGSGHSNIALVGDLGAGKTTTVYAFAQRLMLDASIPSGLRFNQLFMIDSAAIVSSLGKSGSLENLLASVFNEAHRAHNAILFFDDAHLLFGLGDNAVDTSNALMPVLRSGQVRVIFALSPNDWQKLTTLNPAIAGLINNQVVPEPTADETMRIMQDQVLVMEHQYKCVFSYQSLQEALRLSARYVQYQAQPGKALKVMEDAARLGGGNVITKEIVQQSIEGTTGVKVTAATTDEKNTLLHLEDELHKRMVNQKRAVNVVASALRRSRSGVGNPNRPIGTFLFLGPTGVGKTELTKALAEAYFNGAEHMIRLDMNEFVNEDQVNQLLAARADVGTTFLGQVRKQPFSVILFDEIEKAHPDVINVFLQMLDEGQMKDSDNQVVSFRDAIIIATSNAGADEIRKRIEAGEKIEQFEEAFTNHLIESGQFKPEFLNRFDEIVLFRPLNEEELLQVAKLIIADVNKTLEPQKIKVSVTDNAAKWLVEQGYDPRLGARPLRRTVQRSVENVVSKKILEESAQPGQTISLDIAELQAAKSAPED